MSNLDYAYDIWKTNEPDLISERVEIGKMKADGIFKTLCGREIKVELSFWYVLNGTRYSYSDMDQTAHFVDGKKLEWDSPLFERYEEDLDNFRDDLVNERLAEEA